MAGLQNRLYFPPFVELPQLEEYDAQYYTETPAGMLIPGRTWCFVAEIVEDTLSQMAVRLQARPCCSAPQPSAMALP